MSAINFERITSTIKQIMKNQKMTYRELAEQLGMSESGVKIRLKRESKIYIFSLKKPRKFNFNTFKNIRNKEYVKKISF